MWRLDRTAPIRGRAASFCWRRRSEDLSPSISKWISFSDRVACVWEWHWDVITSVSSCYRYKIVHNHLKKKLNPPSPEFRRCKRLLLNKHIKCYKPAPLSWLFVIRTTLIGCPRVAPCCTCWESWSPGALQPMHVLHSSCFCLLADSGRAQCHGGCVQVVRRDLVGSGPLQTHQ